MDLPIPMRIIYNAKYRYAIRLKFGGKFLISLTKLVLQAKASISSTITENIFSYCRMFSASVVVVILLILVVILQHISITRSVSQKKTDCYKNH